MNKEQLQVLLDNASEEFLERFFDTLLNAINDDDEPYNKKAYNLLLASLKSENPDDIFISLCGWSIDSLLERTY